MPNNGVSVLVGTQTTPVIVTKTIRSKNSRLSGVASQSIWIVKVPAELYAFDSMQAEDIRVPEADDWSHQSSSYRAMVANRRPDPPSNVQPCPDKRLVQTQALTCRPVSEYSKCCICVRERDTYEQTCWQCKQITCASCLKSWMTISQTCPLCRATAQLDDRMYCQSWGIMHQRLMGVPVTDTDCRGILGACT